MICKELKDKNVLVTGAGSGIGQAAAVAFSKQGCFIAGEYSAVNGGLYMRA